MAADPREPESAAPRTPEPAEPRSAEPRSTERIRQEISDEREGLTRSLSDLREGVNSARRIPLIVGGALAAGIATFLAVKAVRGD